MKVGSGKQDRREELRFLQVFWNDIRRGENIGLYATVVVAFGLAVANLLEVVAGGLLGTVTLSVLGILVVSTIHTRHMLLEISLDTSMDSRPNLKHRSQLIPFETGGRDASEIVVLGFSPASAIQRNVGFFSRKLKDGCNLRFLMMHPTSNSAVDTFQQLYPFTDVRTDIYAALKTLRYLTDSPGKSNGKCEVKLSSVYIPFGIAAFDPGKATGFMTVEPYLYRVSAGDRAHLALRRDTDEEWFDFFFRQFQQLWDEAQEWNGATWIGSPPSSFNKPVG